MKGMDEGKVKSWLFKSVGATEKLSPKPLNI